MERKIATVARDASLTALLLLVWQWWGSFCNSTHGAEWLSYVCNFHLSLSMKSLRSRLQPRRSIPVPALQMSVAEPVLMEAHLPGSASVGCAVCLLCVSSTQVPATRVDGWSVSVRKLKREAKQTIRDVLTPLDVSSKWWCH